MNFYKRYFTRSKVFILILFGFSLNSCAVQHTSIAAATVNEEHPFYWWVEIKFGQNSNVGYGILAVLAANPQPVSLSRFDHFPEKGQPGTLIVYIRATNDQAGHLREALLEGGALAVFDKKINNN